MNLPRMQALLKPLKSAAAKVTQVSKAVDRKLDGPDRAMIRFDFWVLRKARKLGEWASAKQEGRTPAYDPKMTTEQKQAVVRQVQLANQAVHETPSAANLRERLVPEALGGRSYLARLAQLSRMADQVRQAPATNYSSPQFTTQPSGSSSASPTPPNSPRTLGG